MRPALFVLLAATLLLSGCNREKPLAADLAFNFKCSGANDPPSETAIENFIAAHGFTAFNEERVRKQYKLRMYPMAIDGYDAKQRMLDFRGINDQPADEPVPVATIYSVGLYSKPPTIHDAPLEQATQDFVSKTLKCQVLNISHVSNDADREAFYNKIYDAEQKRIAEGRKCDKQSGRPLDTKCPA